MTDGDKGSDSPVYPETCLTPTHPPSALKRDTHTEKNEEIPASTVTACGRRAGVESWSGSCRGWPTLVSQPQGGCTRASTRTPTFLNAFAMVAGVQASPKLLLKSPDAGSGKIQNSADSCQSLWREFLSTRTLASPDPDHLPALSQARGHGACGVACAVRSGCGRLHSTREH
jgi:hypothetical protein